MVVADLVLVDSVQIQAGTVSVLVMEQVAPDPLIGTVVKATVAVVVVAAAAAVVVAVDPDLYLWELDLDLTLSQTYYHWMANQESYLKRVHPIRHFVLNLVRNLNVAVPIAPVPCSWVGFGSA